MARPRLNACEKFSTSESKSSLLQKVCISLNQSCPFRWRLLLGCSSACYLNALGLYACMLEDLSIWLYLLGTNSSRDDLDRQTSLCYENGWELLPCSETSFLSPTNLFVACATAWNLSCRLQSFYLLGKNVKHMFYFYLLWFSIRNTVLVLVLPTKHSLNQRCFLLTVTDSVTHFF